ncbi:MAG: asparagine synthase-related protein [Hyphomicrobiales bacterium]
MMQEKIKVTISKTDEIYWTSNNGIWVRGYVYIDNTYLTGIDFISYLNEKRHLSLDDIKNTLNALNGLFAFIIINDNKVIAGTDICRSIPIFYSQENNKIHIATTTKDLLKETDYSINQGYLKEFTALGFTLRENTLIDNIHQIKSSSILYNSVDGNIQQEHYYRFIPESYTTATRGETKHQLSSIIESAFDRFLSNLNGQQLVIPLSGGYDSRIILAMIRKHNYENVLCYTYGKEASKEAVIAKEIAKRLNYKWIFIEYADQIIDGYLSDPKFKDYYQYLSNHSSMFYMEEYFSVSYLKENNFLQKDCIFIPGHSGDSISGSHLKNEHTDLNSNNDILNYILKTHFVYTKIDDSIKETFLKENINDIPEFGKFYNRYENWNFENRQSRFIVNSCRAYNFYGYNYMLPLWDKDLVNFFNKLSYEFKLNTDLYTEVLEESFFAPMNIMLSKRLKREKTKSTLGILRTQLKETLLPSSMKTLLMKRYDYIAYKEITDQMRKDANTKGVKLKYSTHFSSLIIQWYINQL